MSKTPRIYRNTNLPHVDVPQVDLLTFLFETEHSLATDQTLLHVDAANPDVKLTKADLSDLTQRVAHGLRHQYGLGSNRIGQDVVTVISYGQVLIPAVYYGIIAAGGIYSAASPSSTISELARQIRTGKSNLIVCSSEHKDTVRAAAKECGVPESRILVVGSIPKLSLTSIDGQTNAISNQKLKWERITDSTKLKKTIITILWSSGTTGLPKGVALSHLNFVAETYIGTVQNRMFVENLLKTDPSAYTPVEVRTLGHLPISHIAGFMSYLILPIYAGGTVYWMKKYNWPDLLKYMKKYKITAFYTVPSIYLRISKSPDVTDHFQYVIAASTGAAPMDAKLQTSSNRRLGDGQNTFIGQTWGLSETTGAVTAIPAGQSDVTGCIGFILPNVELRLVDEDYNDVEPGQEGELLIRAPMTMEGYFNNEQATKEAFHDFNDDGRGPWFCSGDIGVMKDGKFYVVDRKKELLKYKGLQIAPAEIENLLFTHPAVAEAAVVGIPAPEDPGTDLPRAYIVLSEGALSGSNDRPAGDAWPATAALEAQASAQRSSSGDSSKQDTLSQTQYTDVKQPRHKTDTSQQDTLSQTRYTDVKQSHATSDPSKQDTLSQTRYTDTKATSAPADSWPSSPALAAQASQERAISGDASKQDTLNQTRYTDKKVDTSKQDTLGQTRYFDAKPGNTTSREQELAEELKRYVAERLAAHKQLRGGIKFVPEIPKNAIGKFLRRDLRIRAKKEVEEERGDVKAKL